MGWIDLILNLAGILLWLNWRAIAFTPMARPSPVSLLSTLKKAEPPPTNRWAPFLGLLFMLLVRGVFYWHIGSSVDWMAKLRLGPIALPFRSDYLGRMMVFSLLSFGQVLATFYLWLLLLSAVHHRTLDNDSLHRVMRLHLGWFDRLPLLFKYLLPFLTGTLGWILLDPVLVHLGIIPAVRSTGHLWQQAVVLGLSTYLDWKIAVVILLLLHLLNSYVYLGNYSVWTYVNASARRLLRPIEWLPLHPGKVDLGPLVGVALVFLAAELGTQGLTQLFQRLPLDMN